MIVEWDVPVPASDGLVLRADVYRPNDARAYPVLLSYGPYAKGLTWESARYAEMWEEIKRRAPEVVEGSSGRYQSWEVVDPEKWVPDGYVCVRLDSRGAGRSPGYLDPLGSPRERQDLYEAIEWAAEQPWSTGKVGLAGISYYAITQWQVAALKPPHLAAICPWEGFTDLYRDATHHGGIPMAFLGRWMERQVTYVQHGLGERGERNPNNGELISGPPTLSDEQLAQNRVDLAEQFRRQPLDGEFYRGRTPDLSRIDVPLLTAANWAGHGLHTRGNFNGFLQAGSEQKWLEVHSLEHYFEFYTDYGRNLQRRFFDHFLKGDSNGWDEQPRVHLRVRHADDSFVDRAESEWPLARTNWTKLYLAPRERALTWDEDAEDGTAAFTAMQDHVTFMSPPFERETEITGPMAAKLFVSSSTSDADLFLVIHLFEPDGKEVTFQGTIDPNTPLAQGWLRASHRKLDIERSLPYQPWHTHDEIQPLTPGEVYEVDVEVWPTCIVVPPGYRIGFSVRGADYEHEGSVSHELTAVPNPMRGCGPFLHDDPHVRPAEIYGGRTTVYGGASHPSHLLVPIIDGP